MKYFLYKKKKWWHRWLCVDVYHDLDDLQMRIFDYRSKEYLEKGCYLKVVKK